MCNFIDDIPAKSKTSEVGGTTKKYLELYLKETPPDQFYRFRLIGISTKQRDNPFIEKYVHEIWTVNEDGKRVQSDYIVCPRTKYVGKNECPVCKHGDQLWITCKNSNWTDKLSQKKKNELARHYRAHLLVYVVNDPNYSNNNGKLKVITFADPEEFKTFYNKAKDVRRNGIKIFNGGSAVDLWMRVGKVETKWYEGTPRETTRYSLKIVDMGFSTKPYPIPTITPALVDGFPFDEEFFDTSTESEVMRFYNKHCTGIGVEIPADDIMPTSAKPVKKDTEKTVNTIKANAQQINTTVKQEILKKETAEISTIDDADLNSLVDDITTDSEDLADISFNTSDAVDTEVDADEEDLDKLLNNILDGID